MQDFPMFTTEYGVASLILKEVPYRQEAYIIIQSTEQPEELLKECVSFCRMVGAEKIYARGHEIVETYPIHCDIYEMRGSMDVEEEKVENLWPVTEETIGSWRQFLNEQMRPIDNAGTLEKKGEKEILDQAKKEAEEIIKGANKQVENTIKTIKESQAAKEETQEARKGLQDFMSILAAKKEQEQRDKDDYIERKIKQIDARRERQMQRKAKKADDKAAKELMEQQAERERIEAFRSAPPVSHPVQG